MKRYEGHQYLINEIGSYECSKCGCKIEKDDVSYYDPEDKEGDELYCINCKDEINCER